MDSHATLVQRTTRPAIAPTESTISGARNAAFSNGHAKTQAVRNVRPTQAAATSETVRADTVPTLARGKQTFPPRAHRRPLRRASPPQARPWGDAASRGTPRTSRERARPLRRPSAGEARLRRNNPTVPYRCLLSRRG